MVVGLAYRSLNQAEKRLFHQRRSAEAGKLARKAEACGVPLKQLVYKRTEMQITSLCRDLGVDLDAPVKRQRRRAATVEIDGKQAPVKTFSGTAGYMALVPTGTKYTIVSYSERGNGAQRGPVGDMKITAIVPRGEQEAEVQWYSNHSRRGSFPNKTFVMDRPTLLMTMSYSYSRSGRMSVSAPGRHGVKIATMDGNRADNKVWCKPYEAANVYSGGRVCFGGNEMPKTLRSAWGLYWATPFNPDFGNVSCDGDCDNIAHSYYGHHETQDHRHNHQAFSGPQARRRRGHISVTQEVWDAALRSEAIAEEYRRTGSVNACACCFGVCDDSMCGCDCECCRGRCACRCGCDLTDDFIDRIKNWQYQGGWEDWTQSITGEKFFSATGDYDGVFISPQKAVLEVTPQAAHKDAYGKRVVFGMIKLLSDKYVQVFFGRDQYIVMERDAVLGFSESWDGSNDGDY